MSAGRRIDLGSQLLDRQIVDVQGRLAGKVDDLELTFPLEGGAPYVSGIRTGTGALARRTWPRLGRWLEGISGKLVGRDDANLVSFGVVAEVGSDIRVVLRVDELPSGRLEAFVRRTSIERIPGAGDAPE